MRALLVVALLAPVALAQTEPVDWVQAAIEPFPDEVTPLQGTVLTTMTTRVSCALVEPALQQIAIQYVVVAKPSWATVVVSPATDAAPIGDCAGGYAVPREAAITVTADDQAPAFEAGEIVIDVQAGEEPRRETEQAQIALSAGYFAVLDASIAAPQALIPPGGAHEFHIAVTNFGNGPTRVEPLLLDVTPGLEVMLPAVAILGSRQQGATEVSADLVVRVRAVEEDGFVNRVGVINMKLVGSYAPDPSEGDDESAISMLVTVRSGANGDDGPRSPVPAPGALALVGVALALACARRRGSPR